MVGALASRFGLLGLQLFAVFAALLGMAASPPASGRILIVPLWPGAGEGVAAHAIGAGGARLLGRGPFANSIIVYGARAELAKALPSGVVLLAAPAVGCGDRA